MNKSQNSKPYDLEERTRLFAKEIIAFGSSVPKTMANLEVSKQLIRSAGSVGANYIEANDSLGKKDFAMRIRICRKEAKESRYWLNLVEVNDEHAKLTQRILTDEADQLMKIFGAILQKTIAK